MGRYAVYVNHPNDKAFVHHESCSFAKVGTGTLATGYWQKWFDTGDIARAWAKRTGKSLVKDCYFCRVH